MIFAAERINADLYKMGDRYIGIDRSKEPDMIVECEVRKEPDGTITVLDIRKTPQHK